MSEPKKYSVEMPRIRVTLEWILDNELPHADVCLASDVQAAFDKYEERIAEYTAENDALRELVGINKKGAVYLAEISKRAEQLEAELTAERERSNGIAREVAILRVDAAKIREETLREALRVLDKCPTHTHVSVVMNHILALIDKKDGHE